MSSAENMQAIAALKQCHTDCHQALHHLTNDGSVTLAKQLVARLIAKAANALSVLSSNP